MAAKYKSKIWYPCSQMKDFEDTPPIKIARGKGVFLYDTKGKRYFDAISSWWVNLFGHSNPDLNRVLKKQIDRLEHVILAGCTHEPAIKLADELTNAAPKGLTKVFYADNGSSAVEVALKMSFQYWRQTARTRKIFVALRGGYHGETVGALSLGGMALYRKVFEPLLIDVKYADAPKCTDCPYGLNKESCAAECLSSLEDCVRLAGAANVSAVIVEPLIQCANGMNMYPPAYLKKLKSFCLKENVHLIADEIAVGFGRTGRLFACEHAGISPDFLCLSKGITGGYMPFSAVLTGDRIYDAFYADYATGKAFLHSHSYTGNPLACVLALEVLRKFNEENVLETLKERISVMSNCLEEISLLKNVRNTRQTGFVAAFDLVNGRNGSPYDTKLRIGRKAALSMTKSGYLMRPLGDTLYLMPPLITPTKVLLDWKKAMIKVLRKLN
ncbi:MAG: adenosylmethionine--8-amino-7-oxononanoate transaminase [Fibrobacteres bacterium]|nr:adenosylmethionine--8-amino-7-oxononanoate transaminase [Fibrobacterota bacterium]